MSFEELLIRREPAFLQRIKGKVRAFTELPDVLMQGPLVSNYVQPPKMKGVVEAIYIPRVPLSASLEKAYRNNYKAMMHLGFQEMFLKAPQLTNVPEIQHGIWSGYRSCLIKTQDSIYRLKGCCYDKNSLGIRLGPDSYPYGGQYAQNATFERTMTYTWNNLLISEGIPPVMEVIGQYDIGESHKGYRLATSIIKVKGDTRLDELISALSILEKHNPKLYHRLGVCAGSLLGLMHRNGMTWSQNPTDSNAHAGNVVIYPKEGDFHLGLVDFDAACTSKEFTCKKEREKQMRKEKKNLPHTLFDSIGFRFFGPWHRYSKTLCLLYESSAYEQFSKGIKQGYQAKPEFIVPKKLLNL